ncbi:MAG: ribosome silencing factor [Flavobacteriales bacterium]|nr:ribosome silencing factor [Flavobacteriales bacterium]
MTKKKKNQEESKLLDAIIHGIEEKKGTDIVILDLENIPNSICSYFVICTGSSSTQVEALADSITEEVHKALKIKPWHVEGYENKQWILIDYIDVVVHVFQPDVREFYGIEELWADAALTRVEPVALKP